MLRLGTLLVGVLVVLSSACAPRYRISAPTAAPSSAVAGASVVAPRLPQPRMAAPIGQREPGVVSIQVETKEVIGSIDEGVPYTFWTFDGTVPGPMHRVRQGDTVELTLHNAKENAAAHSIDLHAVTGPGGGAKATQVPPGESATFSFTALNPGVYVYHCATAPIPMHVANGMYGLIVVEPPEGLPPVDRELYVMQGDFYVSATPGPNGVRYAAPDRMVDEKPTHVLFNGAKDALTGERALQAQVGEKVRIFFGAGGPNLGSSFHLIGEIFDRVAKEGASELQSNVQTTYVPAGGATMVELTADVPGDYLLVDHSLSRLDKGAVGVLRVTGPENAAIFNPISGPPPMAGTAGALH
jgi:nitrite reductase (NO-forming)